MKQIIFAVFAFLFILYLEFFKSIGMSCPEYIGQACVWVTFPVDQSFTPQQLAFIIVILWLVIAPTIQIFSRPSAGSLPTLSKLVDDLIYEKQFSETLKLIEPFLSLIKRASRRELNLQSLHDNLAAMKNNRINVDDIHFDLDRYGKKLKKKRSLALKFLQHLVGHFSVLIPDQQKAEDASKNILRVFFKTPELITYIAQLKPYFAISLLKLNIPGNRDFSYKIFTALISDTDGVLYKELKQNEGLSNKGNYLFPERNRILHFLFANPKNAENLGIWKPVGDHMLKVLQPEKSPEFISLLNKNADYFQDECWVNPVFMGMRFFDLMVTAAAHAEIKYHMWLYYIQYIIGKLEKIYNTSHPSVNIRAEFPTHTARLIYEAIDTLCRWVGMVSNLPEGSHHRVIQPDNNGDNRNIPVSAARALGASMAIIVMSDKISDMFAGYMHEMVMHDIQQLGQNDDENKLRAYLIKSIVQGGGKYQYNANAYYGRRLSTLWDMADDVLRCDLEDYKSAINAEYPGVLP